MQVIANRGFSIALLVYQGKVLHVRKRQGAGALQHAGFSPGGGIWVGKTRHCRQKIPKTHLKIALIKNRPKRAPKGNDCLVFQPDPFSDSSPRLQGLPRFQVLLQASGCRGVKPPEWGCHLVSKWSCCCCKILLQPVLGVYQFIKHFFCFRNLVFCTKIHENPPPANPLARQP